MTDYSAINRQDRPVITNWERLPDDVVDRMKTNALLNMGWGDLIFAHTFEREEDVIDALLSEKAHQRHIAFHPRDPHVLLAMAPQQVFLDPSHTYRLQLEDWRAEPAEVEGFSLRHAQTRGDVEAINDLYLKRRMFPIDIDYVESTLGRPELKFWLAVDDDTHEVIGAATGVDHVRLFDDPENGCSFWCLAVDPQTARMRVGAALLQAICAHFQRLGRTFIDLSVMHDNAPAIRLYEKMGFQRVPIFCLKRRNPFNEPLFAQELGNAGLNPYAGIIVEAARRRGIEVQLENAAKGYFRLIFGGRRVLCREALTEMTSAVAMSRCDDKQETSRLLNEAGLSVPAQRVAGDDHERNAEFLKRHGRLVVKPARGEQGHGVVVDVRNEDELREAITRARDRCDTVLMEEMVDGEDLRIIVINGEVVAAAVRRPAEVVGTGEHTIRELIGKVSRRRAAATGGESRIPLDAETERCVRAAGFDMDAVLEAGAVVRVRKTANLHTGGSIHDVTPQLNPQLAAAALLAAATLDIPVVGLDFIVPDVEGEQYVIIEANERPGLANHEPQPTAEKFIDYLFPTTVSPVRTG